MKTILASALFVAISFLSTAQSYDLQLNLQKGQHFTQSMVMDLNMAQNIAGQDINIITRMQFEFAQKVKSVTKSGDYELESEYTRIVITADAMGQKIAYDSKVKDTSGNDATKAYTSAFDKIIGKKFQVVLSPKGKVVEIKGLKELLSSLEKSKLDLATQKLIEGSFDEGKIASNFESSYHIFPDMPVKTGDSWTQKSSMESMFPVDLTTTYTLKEVKDGIAKITATGNFNIQKDDYEVNGIMMKMNFTGTYEGSYDLHISTGITSTSIINMPMKGTMEAMGMEFPVSVSSTTHTTTTNPEN